MEQTELLGTWRLISFESRDEDGGVTYPYGRDARGYITYAADGYMSVAMMTAGRRPWADGDILGGTVEERAEAMATYRSYVAAYELLGDRVLHHFLVSLFPNRVGTTEERLIDYDGTRLSLSTRPLRSGGRLRTNHLVWERAEPRGG